MNSIEYSIDYHDGYMCGVNGNMSDDHDEKSNAWTDGWLQGVKYYYAIRIKECKDE